MAGQMATRSRSLAWGTIAIGAAILALTLAVPVLTINRHIVLSYNEGWNAYFTVRAMNLAAGPLYPPPAMLISNNYPPLSFYLTGWMARLTGDPIVAGRVIALVAMITASGLTGLVARQLGADRRWAAVAAMAMLVYASALYWRYAAMADPQWLAQAVMLAGLALLLHGGAGGTGRPWSPVAIVAAALLTAAALLIKHNLLGGPAAVALWLLLTDRRSALLWGVALVAALALSLVAIEARFGEAFAASVLHHQRVFSFGRLVDRMGSLARLSPLIAIALLVIPAWRDRGIALALLFAAAALGCGIVQRGGEGVSYNAYFEALAALSIVLGVALSQADSGRVTIVGRRVVPLMLLVSLALPLVISAPRTLARTRADLATIDTREAAWLRLEHRVAATDGPVACELLATCFWAGKPFFWDFFNEAQRLQTGTPVAPLADRIRVRSFAAIALTRTPDFATSESERLPQPLPRLIERYYEPVLAAPEATVLMIPRRRSDAP